MSETDLQVGGGYIYQWRCAILLALNYFFEPVRYNPTLFDLVNDFLGQVAEIHLEGEDRESGVDLEDINLVNGDRRILIQVKTKQAEGERWTPTDPLLLKALYRFYDSRFCTEQPEDTRFVFLTNRPFNRTLVRVKSAIKKGTVAQCAEADKLCQYLDRYARREKGKSIDADRFREMLARTVLVEYLGVDEVKANVQAKLQAHGRRDWEQAYDRLYEHFSDQSTRIGGGTVTRASVIEVLGPPRRAAPPPLPTRSTAPAPPDYFTGRQAELAKLAQALTSGDTPQAITALQGMGGIGKTALAAQLAAQLDGTFPGGVFWADLPANQGDPLPVLAAWARLCGQDVSALPDPQARAQAVRGILAGRVAEQGRLLVVLDDVREGWLDGARVLQSARPPGVPLLLTTRQTKVAHALRARVTRLDTLSADEARALLATLTDDALTRDEADRVAELCGHLPLALELAAAAVVQEGAAWLLARLNEAGARLDVLELDDARRKEESVRLTFDLSYQALAERYPETARAFRCLGAFAPAPISPARLAGVLAGSEEGDVDPAQVETADAHLRRLTRWALVHRETSENHHNLQPPTFNLQPLYSLHPLLRDYAAALLKETGEGPGARAAHSAHYLAYAEAHKQPTAADYDILEAERANVLAAMDRAYREKQWVPVRRFAWALCKPASGYLGVRGYWGELRARLEQAVRAAEIEGHQRDAAAFAGNLATLLMNTGDLEAARREYQRVLAIFEDLGDRANVATAYHQLGLLAQATGDYGEARRLYRQSLDIKEELGNRAGIASTRQQLGALAQVQGDTEEAQRHYSFSIKAFEEIGDVVNASIGMFNLALLCEDQGRLDEALPLLEQVVEIFGRVGSPHAETIRPVLERVRGQLER